MKEVYEKIQIDIECICEDDVITTSTDHDNSSWGGIFDDFYDDYYVDIL